MPGERRRLRVWPIALVATVALAAAWLGAHHLREVPPDPFADESFAPVVSAEENGLTVARALSRPGRDGPTFELVEGGRSPDEAWELATERLVTLREELAPMRETLDTLDERPRFVEDCAPGFDVPCDLLPVMWSTELAGVAALAEVAELTPFDDELHVDEDAWRRADRRLARAVERARDFHASSYSLVGIMVGIATLARVIESAAPVVHGARAPGVRLPALEAALDAPFPERSLRRGFVFDQRMMRRAVSEQAWGMLFDRARTAAEIDAHTEALVAYADDPSRPAPTRRPHADRPLWWLYDPAGKELLDMMLSDPSRLVPQATTRLRDAESARIALLATMREAQ